MKPLRPLSRSGPQPGVSRRAFCQKIILASAGAGLLPTILPAQQPPSVGTPAERPKVDGGTMTGDLLDNGAILWSRCDRPATMLVEVSTTESFADPLKLRGPIALEDTDFAAKMAVPNLPAGQRIFYRVRFEDLANPKLVSEPVEGSFLTPPLARRDVLFTWSGDTAGQGYGIDLSQGGMKTYESMRRLHPDFFVHSGDNIYADNPISAEMKLDNGAVWKSIVTEGKSKVAETISEFRANYFYNLLDENVRRFNSETPLFCQWDDHEVLNNWFPGKILDDTRYTEKRVSILAARARRAFFECLPIRPDPLESIYRQIRYGPSLELFFLDFRTYRGPNSPNRQPVRGPETAYFGEPQLTRVKLALLASAATWKVICSDMPLSETVRDGGANFENSCNGGGPPLGREMEVAELLGFLKQNRILNVIWITSDVHHCASIYYDPGKAVFQDFDPFWEFISGPLHAGTFNPAPLDNTFGPEMRFLGIPKDLKANRPPSADYQFFGAVHIDGQTEELTVTHYNRNGERLWAITLPPARSA